MEDADRTPVQLCWTAEGSASGGRAGTSGFLNALYVSSGSCLAVKAVSSEESRDCTI